MKTFKEDITKLYREYINSREFKISIIEYKLKQYNLTLTEKQKKNLKRKHNKKNNQAFKFKLNSQQEALLKNQGIENINLNYEETEAIATELAKNYLNNIATKMPEIMEEVTNNYFPIYKKVNRKSLRVHDNSIRGFHQRRFKQWKKPLNLLKSLILLGLEIGQEFNKYYRPIAIKENNFIFEALVRLHARAVCISQEILALLEAGFPDGAFSRWRTLYEINIIANFLLNHSNLTAEKYLLYEHIKESKDLKDFQKYANDLGLHKFSQTEIDYIEQTKNDLIEKYGRSYGDRDYGWAAEDIKNDLPDEPKPSICFKTLEKLTEFSYMRPYYNLACHSVHSGSKGLYFNLAVVDNDSRNIMVAGPSNYGYTDPAQCTAIALSQITTWLILIEPNLQRMINLLVMKRLSDELIDEFLKVDKYIEDIEFENNNKL